MLKCFPYRDFNPFLTYFISISLLCALRYKSWFVSYRGSRILTLKDSFRIVSHESSQFSKIRLFLRIQRILRILSTIIRNESLKIEICESESLRIEPFWSQDSWSRYGTNPWIREMNPCFYESLIRFPHPYKIVSILSNQSYNNDLLPNQYKL